jgi:hypothetical protein
LHLEGAVVRVQHRHGVLLLDHDREEVGLAGRVGVDRPEGDRVGRVLVNQEWRVF